MGRYKSKQPPSQGFQQSQGMPQQSYPQQPQYGQSTPQQSQYNSQDWPTDFPNVVVGIDRDGVINEWKNVIKRHEDVKFIPQSLDAVRKLRLKGHRLVLFSDQPNISRGLLTQQDVNNVTNFIMQQFGNSGIFSIDGFYFNQSDNPSQDPYAKPNIGMLNRAKQEMSVDWSKGYYVGDTLDDIKMAQKAGAIPVLVRTGMGAETEKKHLKGIDSKYKDVQVFDNLNAFVDSL